MICLCRSTTLCREQINFVSLPSAREVHPEHSVALMLSAVGKHHLVPVENLRYATHGGEN